MAGDKDSGHRDLALHLALEAIDSAEPGAYSNPRPRRAMLQGLIDQHSLRHLYRPGTRLEKDIPLAIERYEDIINQACRTCKSTGTKLFANGSEALAGQLLKKLGYSNPAAPAAAGNDGTASSANDSKRKRPNVDEEDIASLRASKRSRHDENNAPPYGNKRKRPDIHPEGLDDSSPPPKRMRESGSDQEYPGGSKRKRPEIDLEELDSYRPPKRSPQSGDNAASSSGRNRKRGDDHSEERASSRSPKTSRSELARPLMSTSYPKPTAPAQQNAGEQTGRPGSKRPQAIGPVQNAGAGRQPVVNLASENNLASKHAALVGTISGNPAPATTQASSSANQTPEVSAEVMALYKDALFPPQLISKGPDVAVLATPGDGNVRGGLTDIWMTCQEIEIWINEKIKPDPLAEIQWIMEPRPELEVLLVALFGQRWRQVATELNVGGGVHVGQLLEMLPAAAVKVHVWDKPLPWPSAKERAAMFAGEEFLWNSVLHEFGRGIRIETLAWLTSDRKMRDPQFQHFTIRPLAKKLADQTWDAIRPQFLAQGIKEMRSKDEDPRSLWRFVQGKLERVFYEALMLKGLMDCAGGLYDVRWIEHGAEVDAEIMKDLVGSSDRDGPREVAWCVAPMVTRQVTKDTPKIVISKASVVTTTKVPDFRQRPYQY